MKIFRITGGFLLPLLLLIACSKDEIAEQEKNDRFYPRIFGETGLFPTVVQVLDEGAQLQFEGMQFSPADKVSVNWKVDGTQVASGNSYTYTAAAAGDHHITLEVSYNGDTVRRNTNVFVLAPVTNYQPKPYDKILLSYIGENGDISRVDWNLITHLAYKVATVTAAGVMDVSRGDLQRKAEEIVTKAHLNNVPVLMGISGALSPDGWNTYNSNNFGNVIADAGKRAGLVQSIKSYINSKHMDGIDIMMTDLGNDSDPTTVRNVNAIQPLMDELRAALGAGAIITITVATNYINTYYPDLSTANWINVHAFQDRSRIGVGRPLLNPSDYNFLVASANMWKAKYPADKLVFGIPAFGIRFTALDANGNNLNFTSFNYLPYRDILTIDPAAHGKEYSLIDKGCFFNGIPMVTEKGNYIRDNMFLGAYLWLGDYDVTGEYSLTNALNNSMK